MQGAIAEKSGKMGSGVLRYSPHQVVASIDSDYVGHDARHLFDVPGEPVPTVATVDEAHALGANVFLLGIAPLGGAIPDAWYPTIDRAIELGMSVVNGLHDQLGPHYPSLQPQQWIWDIRQEPAGLKSGTGAARNLKNVRVLLIGTDMAVGKMTAGLEIYRSARELNVTTEFVATGQIGMTITGNGVPLDAIRVDFASGSIEREVMRAAEADLVIVEGQGSLAHPASTATLPLLRGSCPTHMILCVRAGQDHLLRAPEITIPNLRDFYRLYEDLAEVAGTFARPTTVAVALNTSGLSDAEAEAACHMVGEEAGLPCYDPVRHGGTPFVRLLVPSV